MTPSSNHVEQKRQTTVAVWTPWGVQRVPRQEFRPGARKRLAGQLAALPKLQDAKVMQA